MREYEQEILVSLYLFRSSEKVTLGVINYYCLWHCNYLGADFIHTISAKTDCEVSILNHPLSRFITEGQLVKLESKGHRLALTGS